MASTIVDPKSVHDIVHVRQLVEESRFNPTYGKVLLICLIIMFMEGWDLLGISYVAADIIREHQFAKTAISGFFLMSAVGTTLGAISFGTLADQKGRRFALMICMVLVGTGSLLTPFASSFNSLLLARFLCGLGLGGVGVSATALVSEYAPRTLAGPSIIIINLGLVAGGVAAGSFPTFFPELGWQGMFWVGGVAAFAMLILVAFGLPESLDFTARREGPSSAKVRERLARMRPDMDLSSASLLILPELRHAKTSIKELFTGRLAITTPLIWCAMMCSMMGLYFFATWMPTLLRDMGLNPAQVIKVSALGNAGSIVGSLLFMPLVAKIRPFLVMTFSFTAAALIFYICSNLSADVTSWMVVELFMGIFIGGSQIAIASAVALHYPVTCRGTGTGWANGVGRIGGILCPALVGLLISRGWSTSALFAFAALAPMLAAIMCALISYQVRVIRKQVSLAA